MLSPVVDNWDTEIKKKNSPLLKRLSLLVGFGRSRNLESWDRVGWR